LTFIPKRDGVLIAMNRDEARARPQALPPEILDLAGCRLLGPREPSGGMWIAASDRGVAFALLNRYTEGPAYEQRRSRGELIPAVAASANPAELRTLLAREPLTGVHPFRLLAFFAEARQITAATWNGRAVEFADPNWQQQHWFSSGLSDELASLHRGAIALQLSAGPTRDAVRALHRSHEPEPGAFSICVHRELVQTLSYTEVELRAEGVTLRYRPGLPCEAATWHKLRMPIATHSDV
jgi:hypothetical protein